MSLSIWHITVVLVLFLLLFGKGKIPALMSDLAAGIKNFRSSMQDEIEDELEAEYTQRRLPDQEQSVNPAPAERKHELF